MECAKITAGVRKAKKKPVKDELDRIKQAEKKKRRLEKALATSAAIRSELEKKKLKKKEEQERLDEEGAAIAEAVALHVLLGEDSTIKVSDTRQYGRMWNLWGNSNLVTSSDHLASGLYPQYLGEEVWGPVGLPAGHLAAQAVSSLKIADDARVDALVFNRIL
ncbi:UNVERIFIED_CONTAM: hypothetical protein Sradi_4619500 [Sesamum radiatum]|uniref:Uncharacterized protein n=1 Tax=Sesamum radiatum TaxID=300843 RepID=A0AAW2NAJ0_SESRA